MFEIEEFISLTRLTWIDNHISKPVSSKLISKELWGVRKGGREGGREFSIFSLKLALCPYWTFPFRWVGDSQNVSYPGQQTQSCPWIPFLHLLVQTSVSKSHSFFLWDVRLLFLFLSSCLHPSLGPHTSVTGLSPWAAVFARRTPPFSTQLKVHLL